MALYGFAMAVSYRFYFIGRARLVSIHNAGS